MLLLNRNLLNDKRGGFTDLFVLIVVGLVVIFISVLFIFMGGKANDQLQETLGENEDLHDTEGNNASQVIDNTLGKTNQSFQSLQWISVFLFVGMVISIFIGSHLVTTKPVFMIPYLFIVIIAVIVSVSVSNAYEKIMNTEMLNATFLGFQGANWIYLNLPIWISIVGFVGGIIMFSRMGKKQEGYYGY